MNEKVLELLAEACGAEPSDLEGDIDLFEEGLLDSFGMIALLVSLEGELGIKIEPTEIDREDIKTPDLLTAYIARRTEG
jgi:D-alanine--poly(phosphoribitol) ligase subunit 2